MATWVDYRGMQVPDSSTGDAGIRLTDNFTELAERAAPINYTASSDPGASDDVDAGFYIGSHWLNTVTPEMWICLDNSADAAVWQSIGGTTSNTREILTGNRTYYVRMDGDDANDGLSNTSSGALLTIQHAVDTIMCIDMRTFDVTIQVEDGTYTDSILINGPWPGSGQVRLNGNQATPTNVVINVTNDQAILVQRGSRILISGIEIRTTTSGHGLLVTSGSTVEIRESVCFGECAESQIYAHSAGTVFVFNDYEITGSAGDSHFAVTTAGGVHAIGKTITLSGTPDFGYAFAVAATSGAAYYSACTFSGSATGKRFIVLTLGNLHVNAGSGYFPGNAAGTVASGGQYN